MSDTLTVEERSQQMARVVSKDTRPEMRLRRLVHGMGYRYRLHVSELPGTPDLVFPSRNAVIFMHGCFWHRHEGCCLARLPKSRRDFWEEKLEKNRRRDERDQRLLADQGWRVLVVWECQLRDLEATGRVVQLFLEAKDGS